MFINMAISFYTSRIVLQALGVSDYGIYNLVGGIVVLFNMLSSSLSSATSRFLTYTLGENDVEKLKCTFSTALIIHSGLALLFFIVAETIGLWFINTQLVISADRMTAANWVYQSAIVSTVMNITQVPYNSLITSHEYFGIFAVISILASCLKLGIAFIVLKSDVDHLILYSILYAIVAITIMLYYRFYCIKNFPESHFQKVLDRKLLPEMLKFSGWNLFGNTSLTISQQGLNIILNWFFGTVINAASGVALQVQAILYSFIGNITAAFKPQIVKEYAISNFKRVNELILLGAKFSSVFTLLITIPLIIKMDFLMGIWLNEVPQGAVVICQILLIKNFFNSFNPLTYAAITATGKISKSNFLCGIDYLLSLIFIYIIIHLTHSYVYAYILNLLTSVIACFIYLNLLKHYMREFRSSDYVLKIMLPVAIIGLVAFCLTYYLDSLILNDFVSLIVVVSISTGLITLLSFYFILDRLSSKHVIDLIKARVSNH